MERDSYKNGCQPDNAFFSIMEACSIAPRGAGSSVIAFNITKSCMVPWHRTAVTGTPASDSFRAYASPSSRSTSFSPLIMSAGGNPLSCSIEACSGETVGYLSGL